jgi:1-aminocyclopropane-1-carboxylate deaminase
MLSYTPIIDTLIANSNYLVDVLRLDLIHPHISGNKWFKLKYNLKKAITQNHKTIITFGGAYSNHIAATAAACKLFNLNSIAVIRSEEPQELNYTLAEAQKNGMQFYFVSREMYAQKSELNFKKQLIEKFGNHYLIPEGGTNYEGVIGCKEIILPHWDYDYILCACGTATTFAGLISSAHSKQIIIGISVLKGDINLASDVKLLLESEKINLTINGNEELEKLIINSNCIVNSYCFNGYAKFNKILVDFKIDFEKKYKLPLDYIYTNKLVYAAFDLIAKKKFKANSKILIIHSGGLQGNKGFEERYHLSPIK